ncbi:MAG: peptide chain release factor N(5)-glutamine methyltransferase [Chloroflexaceae bacterium]|nr:peptide chain release factor N(5)-glutamine methyltransferase [Chloroflexaceae bacterium]
MTRKFPSPPSVTVASLLAWAVQVLGPTSTTPRLDAEILLAQVAGWSRARLLAEHRTVLAPAQAESFAHLVARRANLEPVAYLVGHREFYGLEMVVDPRVLVPRPETELLVDLALAAIAAMPPSPPLLVADIGTGSGAIAIALAVHAPSCHLYATDISADALEVAALNAARHQVAHRVTLLQGDLLAPFSDPHSGSPGPLFDIIVSNPPYTILDEIDAGVARHEPSLALDGGPDGLHLYRRLIPQALRSLRPGGCLLLEIGATQAEAVVMLARAAFSSPFPSCACRVHRDLAGRDRVVAIALACEA